MMILVIIFVFKTLEYIIETQRIASISTKRKWIAAGAVLLEVFTWVIAFKLAFLYEPDNSWRLGAYALGSSLGTYLAISLHNHNWRKK